MFATHIMFGANDHFYLIGQGVSVVSWGCNFRYRSEYYLRYSIPVGRNPYRVENSIQCFQHRDERSFTAEIFHTLLLEVQIAHIQREYAMTLEENQSRPKNLHFSFISMTGSYKTQDLFCLSCPEFS